MDKPDVLYLYDTFDDNKPCSDAEIVTNMTTRSQSTRADKLREPKAVSEAYAKEPAPLYTQDIIRAKTKRSLVPSVQR